MSTTLGGYKMATLKDGRRVRVVDHEGVPGYVERWTSVCSGCSDDREYTSCDVGFGCHECGYTGRRRTTHWVPLHECGTCGQALERHRDACVERSAEAGAAS